MKSGAIIRLTIIGAAGRMGKTVIDVAQNDPEIQIAALCDLGDSIESGMKNCDVAIDFSQADTLEQICRAALHHRKPLVVGTTGHSQQQREILQDTARSVAVILASNFSVGVNVLFWLTRKTAELLGSDFDPEIIETHHTMKKDAPSGTAKSLGKILKTLRNNDIPIQSIREGDVVGEHTVIFSGPGERLELTHRAADRGIFAAGAIRAAKWIVHKPSGLYSMQDVLGL